MPRVCDRIHLQAATSHVARHREAGYNGELFRARSLLLVHHVIGEIRLRYMSRSRFRVPEAQADRKPAGDNGDNKPYEVRISLMSIGLALLVSADPATIQQFSLALRELSIDRKS